MTTHAAIFPTERAVSDYGESTIKSKMGTYSSFTQEKWNRDIKDSSETELALSYDVDVTIPVNSTNIGDALDEALQHITNNKAWIWKTYDAVVVKDSVDLKSPSWDGNLDGMATGDHAGTNKALAIIDKDAGKRIAAHELGHLYGGEHGGSPDEESTFNTNTHEHSLMGQYDSYDCYSSKKYKTFGEWYGICTQSTVQSYIRNNM